MRTRQVRSPWRIVRCKKIAKRRPQRGRLFCCEFRRAAQRYKFARTNAEWHAPVGADASVRPAVCTHENECTDAIAYTVCRGRCPHRPAQRMTVFTKRCGKVVIVPRADRVVRPYRTFYVFAENACNFAIAHCRRERGIDPYKHFTDSHWCVLIRKCVPHNRFVTASPCHLPLHKGGFGPYQGVS